MYLYIGGSNTWINLTYEHPTTSGNKHIPAGGSSGQILKYSASGTAKWDYLYPVGAIYLSTSSTSPASLFGGTWEQIKDRFLLAAGSTYTAGNTGGEATHTLTINEMPSHIHKLAFRGGANSDGGNSPFTDGNVFGFTKDYFNEYSNGLVESVGGSQPHNNMPPYLTVYMWKRVS